MHLLMAKGTQNHGLKKPGLWAAAGNAYQNRIDASTLCYSVQKNVTRNGTLKSSAQPWKTDTTA